MKKTSKSYNKFRKKFKKRNAKLKAVLDKSKPAFIKPKNSKRREYVFFEEGEKNYYCGSRNPKSRDSLPFLDKIKSPFWLTNNIKDATIFSSDSYGINDIIPRMISGAWRIVRIK